MEARGRRFELIRNALPMPVLPLAFRQALWQSRHNAYPVQKTRMFLSTRHREKWKSVEVHCVGHLLQGKDRVIFSVCQIEAELHGSP